MTGVCPFQPNAAFWVSGPTSSGKTRWVDRFLREKNTLYEAENVPHSILYCYGIYQSYFTIMENQIENFTLHKGLPSQETINEFSEDGFHRLIVLDDMMLKIVNDEDMLSLFTMGCHHRNLSVIFITQNIYPPGKYSRSMALNTTYMVLFRNVRDAKQISHLGSQVFPGKTEYLKQAYADATLKPYSYLLIDLSPHIKDTLRLRTNLFVNEAPVVVYLPQ